MRFGIIDLGSNSVRFDLYDISAKKGCRRLFREKQMVRLGQDVFQTRVLNSEKIQKTLEALKGFQKLARSHQMQYLIAVGTCALREASNQNAFLKEVQEETGITLNILSPEEEARLIARGILENEALPQSPFGLIDIGGGSTELTLCRDQKIQTIYPFSLGANRLQQQFLQTSPPTSSQGVALGSVMDLRVAIREHVESVFQGTSRPGINTLIGSSGTVKAFHKMLKKNKEPTQPFYLKSLEQLIQKMIPLSREQLLEIRGLPAKRVDMILAGGILLEEIMNAVGATQLYKTTFSLRDGLLAQAFDELHPSPGSQQASPKWIQELSP